MFQLSTIIVSLLTAASIQGANISSSSFALAQQNTSTTSGLAKEITLVSAMQLEIPQSAKQSDTELKVRAYFSDIPVLIEVARCESQFRHTDKSGNLLRGTITSDDLGVMQINEYYHGDSAKKLDLDITSLNGNMEYARHLYEKYGSEPWNASSKCWKKPTPGLLAAKKI
ncbi:MAG: hypothetical protein AAB391_00695 [Patescibacteria group bacterium]